MSRVRYLFAAIIALIAQQGLAATDPSVDLPAQVRAICSPSEYTTAYDAVYHDGIAIACAALSHAHSSPLLGQYIPIRFPQNPSRPIVLPGKFLQTLLLQPDLLPAAAIGGLSIENTTIQGTLKLSGATIQFPIELRNITFIPLPSDTENLAILAHYTNFLGSFRILDSRFLDVAILIDQSVFARNLFIKSSIIQSSSRPAITMTESRILGDLELYENTVTSHDANGLIFATNTINGNAILTENEWNGAVDVRTNESRQLHITGLFVGDVQVTTNDVRELLVWPRDKSSSIFVDGNFVKADARLIMPPSWQEPTEVGRTFSASDNSISGNMFIQPSATIPETQIRPSDGGLEDAHGFEAVRISGNAVRGDLHISLPPWFWPSMKAEFDISANHVDDEMKIGDLECNTTHSNRRLINLSNTSTQRFAWNISKECNVRWTANGFHFNEWVVEHKFADSFDLDTGQKAQAMWEWVGLQSDDKNPEMLRQIADYLIDRGYNSTGRDVLQRANESTYTIEWTWNIATSILDLVTWLYLLPTGYGAKPERALAILFFFWAAGLVVYWGYVKGCGRVESGKMFIVLPNDNIVYQMIKKSANRIDWPNAARQGKSEVPGFNQYDDQKRPKRFSVAAFATDASLPFINLHAYGAFYPDHWLPRGVSFMQHFFGWWMLTSFLASAAVLGS